VGRVAATYTQKHPFPFIASARTWGPFGLVRVAIANPVRRLPAARGPVQEPQGHGRVVGEVLRTHDGGRRRGSPHPPPRRTPTWSSRAREARACPPAARPWGRMGAVEHRRDGGGAFAHPHLEPEAAQGLQHRLLGPGEGAARVRDDGGSAAAGGRRRRAGRAPRRTVPPPAPFGRVGGHGVAKDHVSFRRPNGYRLLP